MPKRYIDADEFVKRVIQYPRQSTKTIGLALADTPTADVVDKEQYDRLLEYANILAEEMRKYQTADVVEAKHGKWKLNKDGNWACPFCEFDPYHDNMKGMNYCPNCGAYMREEIDNGGYDQQTSGD